MGSNFVDVYMDEPERLSAAVGGNTLASVRALAELCKECCEESVNVELYLDEERFPEMWAFVAESEDTPLVAYTPADDAPTVGYWSHPRLKEQIAAFQAVDLGSLAEHPAIVAGEEIERLIAMLEAAERKGRGVYVFFET